jgi:hypothetical protein
MLLAGTALAQDKLYGTNADNRVVVGFKVSQEIVGKLLPAGWESNPAANGANLGITMVEGISAEDAEGKPTKPYSGVAITLPAKKTAGGGTGAMVAAGIFTANYAPGAYGVFLPGKVTIDRRSHMDAEGRTKVEETWNLASDDGHSLHITVAYTRGDVKKNKVQVNVYSAAKPEFYRVYRFEQGTEVVKDPKFSIKATGPKLAWIFDGKQQLVAVTACPWYSRAVSLPVM